MKAMIAGLALTVLAAPVMANDYEPSMRDYLESEILLWAFDPTLIEAVRAQNARLGHLSQDRINQMDLDWRAQVGTSHHPLVDEVLMSPAADFLSQQVEESAGVISEVFIMDSNGMNVAASSATSDYWQGDEAKFIETYDVGTGAVHVGDVEFDESVQAYLGQISISLTDPDTQEVIGAITVGLNAEMLY
ncbi:hypothetical protein DL237_08890 [Pseudooceanicola sediminis]|uniref:Uncharacterized protein n=1 Tax=Pseudooceanicola sediminis TaxID=2211117 RepID=A0A399J5L5_9RHOB|nr:hypothetical protein [Pseudooceanicola sediminis]KAA2316338.1 hypothetical protein E0K93_05740 [Puniceibacterium sp. HSS470]RII39252.1 hypothetical protein DL237_08890 [Pseudooceanicola sediminis]|tara:strand:+ start:18486 stop:19055 length:570 start_codon:yes stop_codon:yes gene_type:complete